MAQIGAGDPDRAGEDLAAADPQSLERTNPGERGPRRRPFFPRPVAASAPADL
jgi:hypothetical protein